MAEWSTLYLAGRWDDRERATIDVVSPSSELVVGRVPQPDVADVDTAVRAAAAAQPAWAARTVAERAGLLRALADGLEARQGELTDIIVDEVGMPRRLAEPVQVGQPVRVIRMFADLLETHEFEAMAGTSRVILEPVGVVAAITPWNFPLHQTVLKVAPALAAGCSVVLKPSGLTPLNAFLLAEVVANLDLPAGAFSVLPGGGAEVGEALATHPLVDFVSFTGSPTTGRRIMELAARNLTPVALELGGKSANVILPGADLERAVRTGVNHALLNSGQACNAWTRMLVNEAVHDQAVELAVEAVRRLPLGDPRDPATRLGPVRTEGQRQRILEYIRSGQVDGAHLAIGGSDRPEHLDRGHYVAPTVFGRVARGMRIAREEIFGPVLSVMPYRDRADALLIANDSDFGLGGGVWAADDDEALTFAREMRTGQVDLNGAPFNAMAPFGGRKQSGFGRELGREGLDEFLVTKAVQFRPSPG